MREKPAPVPGVCVTVGGSQAYVFKDSVLVCTSGAKSVGQLV